MKKIDYTQIASFLEQSETNRREVIRITNEYSDLSIEDAYQIQEEIIKLKTLKGHLIVGPIMGLTS